MYITEYNRTIISPDLDYNTEERKITLIDVIRFCSGSQYILESMKSKGTIKLIYPGETSQGRRIEAHTCAIILEFPVTERYCNSSESFTEHFCDDIVSSPVFGKI